MTTLTNWPAGMGDASAAVNVGIGSSAVLGSLEHVVRVGRELALARTDPAVLDERLVAVGAHLADRGLQIDVGCRRSHPEVDGSAPDDGGVRRERRRDVGDRGARRVLLPVPLPLRRVAPQAAGAGVGPVVGERKRVRVRAERVDAGDRRRLRRRALRSDRSTRCARWCPAIGKDEKLCSKPGYGSPAVELSVGEVPAPLSNSTRTCGSCSNAASAALYVGIDWIGSAGNVTRSVCGRPMAVW